MKKLILIFLVAISFSMVAKAASSISEQTLRAAIMLKNSGAYAEAIELYKKAAALGNGAAANSLGVLYYKDDEVKRDLDESIKWFKKAADLGEPLAEKNLKEAQNLKIFIDSLDDLHKPSLIAVSYTHLTLPTNREV